MGKVLDVDICANLYVWHVCADVDAHVDKI